jgi:hypothetical protein
MAEQCRECGAELLPRQRFCRQCGAAVAEDSTGEVETVVLRREPAVASTLTSPVPKQVTDQVYQQQTAYSSSSASHGASPLSSSTARRFLPLILIIFFGSVLLGVLLFMLLPRSTAPVSNKGAAPPSPPVKVVVNHPAPPAPTLMTEEGATITDDKTVITRTYPLGDNASVSLVNLTGNVTIEGWDQPEAEVKVKKEGGTQQDRQSIEIRLASSSDQLSLETSPTRSSPVEVHYEVRLPRRVRQLEIKSADSKVELSRITGAITVVLQGSEIELKEVSGAVRTKIVSGDTKATLRKDGPGGPQEFTSVSGDIELRLEADANVDIKAETIDGEIDIDDDLELRLDKRKMGQSASGRIGRGGVPVTIKTVSGDIKISN